MHRLPAIPKSRLTRGKHASPALAIPVGVHRVVGMSVLRDNWSDTGKDVARVSVMVSEGKGQTWKFLCGFTAFGGELRNRDGAIATHSSAKFALRKDKRGNVLPVFPKPNRNRRLQVVVETDVDLDTEADLELD